MRGEENQLLMELKPPATKKKTSTLECLDRRHRLLFGEDSLLWYYSGVDDIIGFASSSGISGIERSYVLNWDGANSYCLVIKLAYCMVEGLFSLMVCVTDVLTDCHRSIWVQTHVALSLKYKSYALFDATGLFVAAVHGVALLVGWRPRYNNNNDTQPRQAGAARGVEKKKLSLFITCSIVQAKLARTLMNPGNDEIVKCSTEPDNPSKYEEDEFCKSESGNCITRHDTKIQHVGSSNVDVNVKAKRRRRKISTSIGLIEQTSFEFPFLDARIKPWFEATSRVIGTVMMHNVSSGRTIADASTHGSTSPAKTNLKGQKWASRDTTDAISMTAHCSQNSWVTRVAALKSHGLHWSQHLKGTGQNHLISIQLDTPSKLNLNGTRVAAFNYVVALKSYVASHNWLPIRQSLFANLAINTNEEKVLEEIWGGWTELRMKIWSSEIHWEEQARAEKEWEDRIKKEEAERELFILEFGVQTD
ncbi:hypothetical protein Tco_0157338 [Tanacetum coccineum]